MVLQNGGGANSKNAPNLATPVRDWAAIFFLSDQRSIVVNIYTAIASTY